MRHSLCGNNSKLRDIHLSVNDVYLPLLEPANIFESVFGLSEPMGSPRSINQQPRSERQ